MPDPVACCALGPMSPTPPMPPTPTIPLLAPLLTLLPCCLALRGERGDSARWLGGPLVPLTWEASEAMLNSCCCCCCCCLVRGEEDEQEATGPGTLLTAPLGEPGFLRLGVLSLLLL